MFTRTLWLRKWVVGRKANMRMKVIVNEEVEINDVNNEMSPFKYVVLHFSGNSSLHYDVKVRVNEVLNTFGEMKKLFQV